MAKQSIEQEMARRGWTETAGGMFYRDNGDASAQSVKISDWTVDPVWFANKAEDGKRRDKSKQYWLTYCPTVI